MGFNKKLDDLVPIVREDLQSTLDYWKSKVDTIITEAIFTGFDMEIDDTIYHFKYSLIDQTNMANARADALTSIQLTLLESTRLEAMSIFGLDSNGNIDRGKSPTDDSDTWARDWPVYIDGIKNTLRVDALTMLAIAKRADDHVSNTKQAMTDKYLVPLQVCTTNEAINTMAISLQIDKVYRSST